MIAKDKCSCLKASIVSCDIDKAILYWELTRVFVTSRLFQLGLFVMGHVVLHLTCEHQARQERHPTENALAYLAHFNHREKGFKTLVP
jgi:hypothetical protein